MTRTAPAIPSCKFPSHLNPRIWLLSSGASPIAIALSRQLLAHGDVVAFGVQASDTLDTSAGRAADFTVFWTQEVLVNEGWKDRAKLVRLDGRCEPALMKMGQCQAAVAEVITLFRRLDILFCCSSQGVFDRVALCVLTTHILSDSYCRHCRGTIIYLSINHSHPRSIRNKLLRPRQHHQGCLTLDERKALRSYHTAIRHKWVTPSIQCVLRG
ncbi:MAG: hypothetical protein Q9198_001137 [Flavoplaca austrocitrina]